MLDSQLAKLLLSDKIDTVVDKDGQAPDDGRIYVKGYSHLSFHQENRGSSNQPQQSEAQQIIIKDNLDDDNITEQSINMYARGSNVYKQSNKQFISNVR